MRPRERRQPSVERPFNDEHEKQKLVDWMPYPRSEPSFRAPFGAICEAIYQAHVIGSRISILILDAKRANEDSIVSTAHNIESQFDEWERALPEAARLHDDSSLVHPLIMDLQ